ncbi:uncharacterized protein LOC141908553 [Tubulanus polymorphus]|uniref:uncharacterized protein LOC141908553 n=1 Tax=Tubulanus polymorphus TaxID=672921 RepID=UPI003DA28E0B
MYEEEWYDPVNDTAQCWTQNDGRWQMNAYILPPFIIVGFVSNSLTLVVFVRLKYDHRSAFLLSTLAITDNLFLIIQFILEPLRYFLLHSRVGTEGMARYFPWNVEPRIYIGSVIFYKAFLLMRNWLTVLIQVERLITILMPLTAGLILTKTRLKVVIFALGSFSVGFGMYYPATLTVVVLHKYICVDEEVTFRSKFQHEIFAMFNFLIDPILRAIIPTFLVFIANILLLIVLYVKLKEREDMTNAGPSSKLSESKATKMVITMSVVFLLFEIPGCVSKIYQYITDSKIEVANTVYNITSVLNSCVNFILYYLVNANFRATANNLVRMGKNRK